MAINPVGILDDNEKSMIRSSAALLNRMLSGFKSLCSQPLS